MKLFKRIKAYFKWLFRDKYVTIKDINELPQEIPQYEYELIARSFLPFIVEYFENSENMKEFENIGKDI